MVAVGWFHCAACGHRARASVRDRFVLADLTTQLEARAVEYRRTVEAREDTVPVEDHPELARTLEAARCPRCDARDRRVVRAFLLRAALRAVLMAALLPSVLIGLYVVRGGTDVARVLRSPEARPLLLVLAVVSGALGLLTLWAQWPKWAQIDRRVRWL